jgi:hypothetical protein
MMDDTVPEDNLRIYRHLYVLEVGLRELIIEALGERYGPRWWKRRLPADLQAKYRGALDYERGIKWSQLVPHHPLYYIDFPDLRKIVSQSDNWKDVFKTIFGREDILIGTLNELEPIRNKIAHNRKASPSDLDVVIGARQKLATSIGEDRLRGLTQRCTMAPDIYGSLVALHDEARSLCARCLSFGPIEFRIWTDVGSNWWFDSDYLGQDISSIKSLFSVFEGYAAIPRVKGSGHKIERWVKEIDLEVQANAAEAAFSQLFESMGPT